MKLVDTMVNQQSIAIDQHEELDKILSQLNFDEILFSPIGIVGLEPESLVLCYNNTLHSFVIADSDLNIIRDFPGVFDGYSIYILRSSKLYDDVNRMLKLKAL